jgi:opacity protein-like surface antigen
MKNLVFLILTLTLFSSTAAADTLSTNNNVYIRTSIGANLMKHYETRPISKSMKFNAKSAPFFSIGIGYHFTPKFRTDLTIDYFVNPTFSGKTNHEGYIATLDTKAILRSFMLNSYIDLFSINNFTVFTGTGIGIAQLKEKYYLNLKNSNFTVFHLEGSTKRTNNLAYHLTLGTSVMVREGIYTELAYSWKDFGKTNPMKDANGKDKFRKTKYQSHNIICSIRFVI